MPAEASKGQKSFLRYLVSKKGKGGGGPIDYFREKRLRRIAKGERAISFEKVASKVFGGGFVGKQISGVIGELFDKKLPPEMRRQAKEQLTQEFGVKFKSDKAKRERDAQQQMFQKINQNIKNVASMIDYVRAEVSTKFDSVMQNLRLLTEPPPETKPSVTKDDIENINRRLVELDFSQRRIEKFLLKGRSGRKISRAVRRASTGPQSAPVTPQEIVSIVSNNTIEDIKRILVERAPQQEADISAILTAIAKQQAINQIEPDEMEEILQRALEKALNNVDLDSSSGILPAITAGLGALLGASVATLTSVVKGSLLGISSIIKTLGPKIGQILSFVARFAGPAALVGGAGYAAYKAGSYINEKLGVSDKITDTFDLGGAEKAAEVATESVSMANSPVNAKLTGTGYALVAPGKYQTPDGKIVGRSALPPEIERRLIQPTRTATPAPAAPVTPTTATLVEQSRENAAAQVPTAASTQPTTPVVQNFYNSASSVAQLPEKQKIQPVNTDNTFVRLLAQDVDHPLTYSNFNMG